MASTAHNTFRTDLMAAAPARAPQAGARSFVAGRQTAGVCPAPASNGALRVKRLLDIVLAGMLLVLIAPLFGTLAILIRLQRDGGSVIYRQRRVGRAGREFDCLKFRSMHPDAAGKLRLLLEHDAQARLEWETSHKLRNDPRVTRLGALLRSTSLDELPQLLNVVRGEMSLVGPRPVTRAELDGPYARFDGRDEYLVVRPGITGLWQVSGRSLTAYERRVALDKSYVNGFSLKSDALILFKTLAVVLLQRGAC